MLLKILQISQGNTCVRASFLIKSQAYKKEALAQVFSDEFCVLIRNTFFTEHGWTAAFVESAFIRESLE